MVVLVITSVSPLAILFGGGQPPPLFLRPGTADPPSGRCPCMTLPSSRTSALSCARQAASPPLRPAACSRWLLEHTLSRPAPVVGGDGSRRLEIGRRRLHRGRLDFALGEAGPGRGECFGITGNAGRLAAVPPSITLPEIADNPKLLRADKADVSLPKPRFS
jgi:hypothetical protein